ncbi:MAG: fumarate hydratase [Mogibacterium sp.]|nr:fumarate hydratase [Mogibacterium sp.]
MREIGVSLIREKICELFLSANYAISEDIACAVMEARESEEEPLAKTVLSQLSENYEIAKAESLPICQDTGMAIVFAEVGQDVHIVGGDFFSAVNDGMKRAYDEGYLRKSVLKDPLFERINTGDNSPVILHTDIVSGDKIKLTAVAKGFGSENMSKMRIFTPAEVEQIPDFIADTVADAGSNSCPPVIVGVGLGGTVEKAALLAKKATIRPIGSHNENPGYAALEKSLLSRINRLGIGPAGLGGSATALAVNLEYHPCHIASVPVVVNLCCHASRHSSCTI